MSKPTLKNRSELSFSFVIYAILILLFIVTFYPFWQVFIISLNDAVDTVKGGLYFFPREFSIQSYITLLLDDNFTGSINVTVLRTLIGAPLAVLCTSMAAYTLSKRDLVGRRPIKLAFIFTMYFGGGLIPYYMILKSMHLIDKFGVYIFPNIINVFYMILVITYIESLPAELEESAKIDGANDIVIFFKIIMPLCMPILATIILFNAINQWNSWFDSFAFTSKRSLKTLQAMLVLILTQYDTQSMQNSFSARMSAAANKGAVNADSIRMAATILATVPIILVYPFLQKYFVKGIMVGAVKA